ncbi:hypothetical protein MNBD_NITROSPINAE02-2076, partial [hydrothermal vent metagenome]
MKQVVITGVGALSPHGEGVLRMITAVTQGKAGVRIGGPIPKVPLKSKNRRLRLDRISKMALYAAWAALEESRYPYREMGETIGISLGTATGGLDQSIKLVSKLFENELDFAAPMIFPNTVKNAAANQIAIALSIYGTNITFAGGPGSAMQGVKEGMILICAGKERAILAGGLEEIVEKEAEARKNGPTRSGEPAGEGACILLLETLDDALKRGADILAELSIVETGYEEGFASPRMEALYATAMEKTGLSPGETDPAIFQRGAGAATVSAVAPSAGVIFSGESLLAAGITGAGPVAMGAYAIRYGVEG